MCVVDGEKPEVDSRDEGKHTGRNDLLFVEKMMYRSTSDSRGRTPTSQLFTLADP